MINAAICAKQLGFEGRSTSCVIRRNLLNVCESCDSMTVLILFRLHFELNIIVYFYFYNFEYKSFFP